ncbi:MAG: HNH endonuclease signature motif containing protein [Bdellovibrionota bacterium]
MPFALGGPNELENLRLVCRSCNQRSAIEVYGVEKMENYIKAPIAIYNPVTTGPSKLRSLAESRSAHRSNRRRTAYLDA